MDNYGWLSLMGFAAAGYGLLHHKEACGSWFFWSDVTDTITTGTPHHEPLILIALGVGVVSGLVSVYWRQQL